MIIVRSKLIFRFNNERKLFAEIQNIESVQCNFVIIFNISKIVLAGEVIINEK